MIYIVMRALLGQKSVIPSLCVPQILFDTMHQYGTQPALFEAFLRSGKIIWMWKKVEEG